MEKKIGDLDTIVVEGSPSGPCVVLLHGYGADYRDLAPLSRMLPAPDGTTWIFPNAPIEVPLGPHMTGRAWFPIDMRALEAAMMTGTHRDFSTSIPEGFMAARESLAGLLEELGRDAADIFLGGFSQGAMLACDLALCGTSSLKLPFRGLLLLSATLVAQDRWRSAAEDAPTMQIFQSHGTGDALLAYEHAVRLRDMLREADHHVDFHSFAGGHELPPQVLAELGRFLLRV